MKPMLSYFLDCRRIITVVTFAVVLFPAALSPHSVAAQSTAAQSGGLDFHGSLGNDTVMLQNIDGGAPGAALAGAANPSLGGFSTFTLNFVNRNRSVAKVEGSVVLSMLYGSYADAYNAGVQQLLGTSGAGIITLLSSGGAALNVDLRKLYLSIYTSLLDLSVGRQIINYGVGALFSPIDAFSAPTLTDLNYQRSGSDVVRVDLPFGDVSGLDAVSTVSDSVSGLTSALKLYTNVADYDLAAVGIYRGSNRDVVTGADFKGDLLLGIHGEAVEHFPIDQGAPWFEGMFGADYSFSDTLFLSAEYYYNGNPAAPGSLSAAAVAAAGRIFLNQHYLYTDARYVINEIMSADLSAILDLSAGSLLATAQYTCNVVQNGDLLAYVRFLSGDVQSGMSAPGQTLIYGVEFRVAF